MRFIIEKINETDCKIIDCDCFDLQGKSIKELVIPSFIEEEGKTYKVKEVGERACWTNKNELNIFKYASLKRLKKIIFSEGIEKIEGVMNPINSNNATERGNAEFLQEVILPSSLKIIGKNSFRSCRKLISINIPEGLEEIHSKAFDGCESLTLFQWPPKLRIVDISAFNCMSLPRDENKDEVFILNVPDSIERITGTVSSYFQITKCNVSLNVWNILDSSNLTKYIRSIDIPEGVKKIKGHFSNVKEITLPSTLKEIGKEAFLFSNALDCITELPKSLIKIGESAFRSAYKKTGTKNLGIPSSRVKIGRNAFARGSSGWTENGIVRLTGDNETMNALMGQPGALNGTAVNKIIIPEGSSTVVDIENCPELREIVIPATVKKILNISECPKIRKLIIPDSVISINSISDNENLECISLSKNLKRLSYLGNCPSLKQLNLPDSLEKLKKNPKDWGSVFKNLNAEIKASPRIWKLICKNKKALVGYNPESKIVDLPEGITELADELFLESHIEKVKLPATLKKIGRDAFKDCKFLISLTFPASLKEFSVIEKWDSFDAPFSGCSSLRYVVFLADNPTSSVFPISLGEKCDWFVEDKMVTHVKNLLKKNKEAYPDIDNIGAKRVLPISLLNEYIQNSGRIRTINLADSKKDYTQPISLFTEGLKLVYSFPLEDQVFNKIENQTDLYILAANCLKHHIDDCTFQIIDTRERGENWDGTSWFVTELKLNNSSPYEGGWQLRDKDIEILDTATVEDLPKELEKWSLKNSNWGMIDRLDKFLNENISFLNEKPSKDGNLILNIILEISFRFDFMIESDEVFSFSKLKVLKDWKEDELTSRCNRYCFLYGNRLIGFSSVRSASDDPDKYFMSVYVQNSGHLGNLHKETLYIDKAEIQPKYYYSSSTLPFMKDIMELFKH